MDKSRIFFLGVVFFIGGIFWRSFFDVTAVWKFVFITAIILLLAIFWKNRRAMLIAFLIVSFLLGGWRIKYSLDQLPISNSQKQVDGKAIIVKEPEPAENYQKIIVEAGKQRILVNTDLYANFDYGDEVDLKCDLEFPQNREDFDYRMYLAKDGIFFICQKAQIKKTGDNSGNPIYRRILILKNKFKKNIEEVIPSPESGLGTGILLGGNNQLSEKIQDHFSKTGMSHVVAVSGYNVTMIAEYLVWLGILLGFWRKQALIFSVVGIFLFVFMIGFPASAVRAGFMSGLIIWAMRNGRVGDSARSVVIAAAIMLLINPLILRYDIGFQLSFLATLGIVEFGSLIQKRLVKKNRALGLSEIVVLSVLAQLFVLPIIIYNFKTVSLISVLANVAVLPFIPITMLFVFLAGLFGFVSVLISKIFAWPAYFLMNYQLRIIEILAGFRWSNFELESAPMLMIFGWWFMLIAGLTYKNKAKIKKYFHELFLRPPPLG